MRIGLIPTLRDTYVLFKRHAIVQYLEFFAASVAGITFYLLLFPQQSAWFLAGVEPQNTLFLILNPLSVIQSVINSLVASMMVVRLWNDLSGTEIKLDLVRLGPALIVLSLLVDHLISVAIGLAFLPGFFLLAITTAYVPALVIEGQGWNALRRSFQMTRDYIWALTGIWALIILPWIILIMANSPNVEAIGTDSILAIWLREISSHLFFPLFAGFSTCMSVVVYRRILDIESGAAGPDLDETFR